MGQGALEGTVAALEANRASLHSLGDLLRVAIDQGAGVSVERLKAKLAEKIEVAFSNWDRRAGLPEKGRGLENPWLKNVGTVLAAYYAREKARQDFQKTQALESERDSRLLSLGALQAKREQARAFVAENESIVEGASQRQAFEAQIAKARSESDAMVKDLSAWMQAEAQRQSFAPEVERLEKERVRLDDELKAALLFAKAKGTLQRLEKAKAAKLRLEEARASLAALPVLKPEDLKRLRAVQAELDAVRTSLKAGKIQLQFSVKKDLDVVMKKDLDSERPGTMVPGKPLILSAGGRIQLSSELFELTVLSGEGKLTELEEGLAQKNEALTKLLQLLKVSSLEEAQEKSEKFAEAASAVKSAEAVMNGTLSPGEKFEDLEKAASLVSAAPSREAELVQAEQQSLLRDLSGKKDGLVRAESLLKELARRHGVSSSEALTNGMVEKKSELSVLEKRLAALPPLPEGVSSLDAFLEKFRAASSLSSSLLDQVQKLSIELAELKAKLPEQSAQDLERVSVEAAAAFDRALAQGKALLRVEEAMSSLEAGGADIFAAFRKEFETQVAKLSAGKYLKAGMQESLPANFQRQDGAQVPYAWLSAGTKDAFALALRLSMASYFLGKSTGFLMLDDPLVNMDPARQKVAASMLGDFAASKQVVLFTCHPAHAELLGGNLIRL